MFIKTNETQPNDFLSVDFTFGSRKYSACMLHVEADSQSTRIEIVRYQIGKEDTFRTLDNVEISTKLMAAALLALSIKMVEAESYTVTA